MLSTAVIIIASALSLGSAEIQAHESTMLSHEVSEAENTELVSHPISVDTSFEKLEAIKAEAEAAGLGFRYKVRGVAKKKLIIDLVLEQGDSYTLDRVVVRAEDGISSVQWMEDKSGQAIAFVDNSFDGITQE